VVEIAELTQHPERLDRDTLYELRSLLALYPYFQPARLLMLQNLYILHDPAFDQELRRAAIYITDRNVLFQMVEAGHYQLKTLKQRQQEPASATVPTATAPAAKGDAQSAADNKDSRTLSLIDDFLDSLPPEADDNQKKPKRKPTPADAAVDYVAYLMESENEDSELTFDEVPQLKGQNLIDSFIEQDNGKIVLNETPTLKPEIEETSTDEAEHSEDSIYTETMARIYIKQGKYSKALEIIRRLSLEDSEKNAYFADQIRFLEKLIINSNKKSN
jgi:hypothetical protein